MSERVREKERGREGQRGTEREREREREKKKQRLNSKELWRADVMLGWLHIYLSDLRPYTHHSARHGQLVLGIKQGPG